MAKPFKEAKENFKVAVKDLVESVEEGAAKAKASGKQEIAAVMEAQVGKIKQMLNLF